MNREMVAQRKSKNGPLGTGGILQRHPKATRPIEPTCVPDIVHEVLRTPGQPLDLPTRSFMESRFSHDFSRLPVQRKSPEAPQAALTAGPPSDRFEEEAEQTAEKVMRSSPVPEVGQLRYDFSQVRVHADAQAAESAHALDARAYTVGQHVVFGAGEYNPGTGAGRGLLAHELTHTLQQAGPHGAPTAQLQRAPASPGEQTLRKGDRGPAVRALQKKLLALGYAVGVDGAFGPETEAAVRRFQKDVGAARVDGVCGPETMRSLEKHRPKQESRTKPQSPVAAAKQDDRAKKPGSAPATVSAKNDKKGQYALPSSPKTEQDRQDKTRVQPAPLAIQEDHKLYEMKLVAPGVGYEITFTYSLLGRTTLGPKDAVLTFQKDAVNFNFKGSSISMSGLTQEAGKIGLSFAIEKYQQIGAKFSPLEMAITYIYTTKSAPFHFTLQGMPVELQLRIQLEVEMRPRPSLKPVPIRPPVPFPFPVPWFGEAAEAEATTAGITEAATTATVVEETTIGAEILEGLEFTAVLLL